jgi:F1F0 ATPase subunit 2
MRDVHLSIATTAAIGLVAGFVAGVAHFALLAWNAQLFVDGSIGKAVALQLARVALATLVLILLARLSLFALLAGAVGFLPARALMVWRFGGLR